MTVATPGLKTRRKRCAGARTAVFFLWVILILSQLGLLFAVHEDSRPSSRSPARKVQFSDRVSFHAPSSIPAKLVGTNEDPDAVYGEDKRLIHTGPNPLHN